MSGAMRLAPEDMSQPFPIVWWRHVAGLGTRAAFQKQHALAVSIAELFWPNYLDAVIKATSVYGKTATGISVLRLIDAYAPLQSKHCESIDEQTQWLDDASLRTSVQRNEGGIYDLVSWYLLYTWFVYVSGSFYLTDTLGGSDEPEQPPFKARRPATFALGLADSALLWLRGELGPFENLLLGMQLAAQRNYVSPPPYEF